MIYIVEIPHERPPSCWTANDKDDFCTRMEQTFERYSDVPDYGVFWVVILGSLIVAIFGV